MNMTRQDLLAETVLESRALLIRYLRGFGDSNRTRQAANLPNHAAWTLGHLAHVVNRCAEKFDGRGLPESDFVHGDGRSGDARRFDTESVAFNSRPLDDPSLYPTWDRCVQIFDNAIDRLANAIRAADATKLDSTTRWGAAEVAMTALPVRMAFHNGTHCGQLADLRRALGMGSIFGG
jgi:hypothetical protein